MKWIKFALAGTVSLLAMTAHAHADFIFTPIAFALFASPLGAVIPFAGLYTGLQIAAYAAVLGAQLALSQRQQPKIDPGELKNTFQEAETPEYNGIGRVRVGGLKAFGNTKGIFISRLIWHLKGPLDGIEEYFVGGRPVVVDPGGDVSSPPWARKGETYLNIKSKVGTGNETAWPQLIADFPTLWTTDHRCRGVFQSLARYRVPTLDSESSNKLFQQLYQGGAPDVTVTARMTPVYDPRDPSQDPDNENTWKWTDNGILCAAHIMRRYPDLDSADFDWAFLAQEADRADQIVATLTGTEPRSRCWGIWPSESRRGDTMQQVLDSIGAEVVLSEEGLIRLRLIDDAPTSEIAITERDIIELDWKAGPDAVERPNICRIKYYSPERGFDMGEINMSGIGWARIDEEVVRYGEKIFDVELPFCPSAAQAQRVARRLFLQARADAGAIRTNMVGMATWGLSYATISDVDADEEMICRIAAPRCNDQEGRVDIPYIVWPQDLIDMPWNPATMEAPAPLLAPDLQYESNLPKPPPPMAGAVVQYSGGGFETRISIASSVSGPDANYRTYTGGLPDLWANMATYDADVGSGKYAWATADTRGVRVDFRVRASNSDGDVSYPSDLLTIDPMAIDNSEPPAPHAHTTEVSDGGGSKTVTWHLRSDTLRVVTIVLERFDDPPLGTPHWEIMETFDNVRPGLEYTIDRFMSDTADPIQWRASARTSNGTPGPYATGTVT
ncbi:phage tail protein [Nitratireductor sp. GCM10026969]|uniref:phage tail protein n=1 Tax=Nitratireductor sp. GCM10026969 TaxID=3252645 RepID=UPI00360B8FB0